MRTALLLLLPLLAGPKVRVAPISLIWDQGHRTLENTLRALDEAAGADLAILPQECVLQEADPLPAIARKAAEHKMYVVANLREREGEKTFITSFLCDREGKVVGKYRKSHRLPYENDFALGDDLPVFATDFGPIGLKIGTDHYFPEIDTVLRRRGAKLIAWSTSPFVVRDETVEQISLQGRAIDEQVYLAVARYAGKQGYGGYKDTYSWTGTWPIGRAQVIAPDGHLVADSGHAGGVAVATIPSARLAGSVTPGGFDRAGRFGAIVSKDLPAPQARPAKRVIRAAAIECEYSMDKLVAKIDACGRAGVDLVCLWEYVWYQNDEEVEKNRERNRANLARIAEAAGRNKLYVVIAGELENGFNEAIVFGRDGKEAGRYTKIFQTTEKTSKYYQEGQKVGIFDLDFGRICVKICADVYNREIDRIAALYQADLVLHPTQDAGPFIEHTRLREAHRCIDDGYSLLRATAGSYQADHRTYVMDPWAGVLASSQHRVDNQPVIATIDLDNRPKYYEWPERKGPYPDPYQSGVQPVAKGELRAVLLTCRRPELYAAK